MVRRLRRTEHPDVIVLSFAAVSAVGAAPFALAQWVWPTPVEWLVLLGVGVATQVGQFCLTRGLHLETAGRATTIGYTQVVFATLWGALFLGELPTPLVLAGAGLVLMGSVLLAVRKAK
jgi:drug/metabolite transporter (DMT)-like permease